MFVSLRKRPMSLYFTVSIDTNLEFSFDRLANNVPTCPSTEKIQSPVTSSSRKTSQRLHFSQNVLFVQRLKKMYTRFE